MPQQWYCPNWTTTTATTTNYYVPTWTSTGSNASITLTNTWSNWNTTVNTTVNSYADQVWQQWVTYVYPQTSYVSYGQTRMPETSVQRAERERAEVERAKERQAARTRARVLLEEFLDDEQKVELASRGRFHVTGSKGRRYCIRTTGQAGNVDLLKSDGGVQATLCCHPRGALPDGDAWLMQMVEIRHDEDHFLATANVHRGHVPVG